MFLVSSLFTFLFSGFLLQASAETVPSGMKLIPSGEFSMGRTGNRADEGPRHRVKISGFYIDETLVTVSAFQSFVEATKYKTTAELRGYGMTATEGMHDWQWRKMPGANWKQPFGAKNREKIPLQSDYPVVSVSWEDAHAYCAWKGHRLPTEAEWEYAMRAGRSDTRFPWGNRPVRENGKLGLNFWQGEGHEKNALDDGFLYMSPVKAFPPNEWGIFDPVGNVWQWVQDWYAPTYYASTDLPAGFADPQGPTNGRRKITRGGSWWCSASACSGFGLFYRGKANPKAVFPNNGFRCAKSR